MCAEYLVRDTAEYSPETWHYCETGGRLAAVLGLPLEQVTPDGADYCLCAAYGDRLGFRRTTPEDGDLWPMTSHILDRGRR